MAAALTYIPLLEKCSRIEQVKQIHAQILKTGLVREAIPTSKLLTALYKTFIATGNGLSYCLQVFNRFQEPNTFMWNTIIRAFSNSQNREQAVLLYCQMLYNAAPHNLYTFPFVISACTLEESQQLHTHIIKLGFACEIHTTNSLMHAYGKFSCTVSARRIFDRIPCPDVISWNTMLGGYLRSGQIDIARRVFAQMHVKNVVSWTSMINGYVEDCLFKEALEVFQDMQSRNIEPDKVALTCALTACAQLGDLDSGLWIHSYIKRRKIQLDSRLGCVLVDMYSKCGELDEAVAIFEKLKERNCIYLWTAMITGFAVHGRGREALDIFEDMRKRGIKLNEVTLTGILTACSYSGLVKEGRSIFKRLVKKSSYEIGPSIEHYGCMVDLLGRAGLLDEAEELIQAMPMEPNVAIWGALLTACRIHRDHERGTRVGKVLIEMDPDHSGRYVTLANIFSAKGEWKQAATVREEMKKREVLKLPGSSLITLDGRVHEFFDRKDLY